MMAVGLLVPALLAAAPAVAPQRGDARNGHELYLEKCVLCHGDRGEGWDWTKKVAKPPVPVPDLATVAPGRSDQFLFDVIKGGGEAVGKTRFMPPFDFQLSEQEIWDLVRYVRLLGRTGR
ncbi:MAG TPA: cytochrome c [Candidatus Methylomirabilis sp.]|jgi:mono/diheme cytochrome c family protein